MKNFICYTFCLFCFLNIYAQQLQIVDFHLDETDQSANRAGSEVFDLDDNPCALLRLQTTVKGFSFDMGTIGFCSIDETHPGEIWVWLRNGTRFMSVYHPQLGSIVRYPIPVKIKGKQTYYARLLSGKVTTVVESAVTEQYVKFYVEPEEALVTLDGIDLPLSEGVGYRMMLFGEYDYRVEAADYHPNVGKIKVNDPDNPHELHIRLKPAFGWIKIDKGMADGSSVYVDNRFVGKAPLQTDKLLSGSHRIKILKPNYAPWEKVVTIEDEQILTLQPDMEGQFAYVTFTVPENVDIYINDQKRGSATVSGEFVYGPYIVETRKEGYRSSVLRIELTPQHHNQTITLQPPTPIYGTVQVESNITDATVFLDNEKVGRVPLQLRQVLIGKHTITLKRQGYADAVKEIEVEEGKTITAHLDLHSSITATLTCTKPNAQIFIREKGTKEFRSLGVGTWTGQLSKGDYEGKTTIPGATDVITQFSISKTNTTITLNAPKTKLPPILPITVRGQTFNMIRVEGGTFSMGATDEQGGEAFGSEKPVHTVTLSTYFIAETEVTQALWYAVMGTSVRDQRDKNEPNGLIYGVGQDFPMFYVTYNDCLQFIQKLNEITKQTFRLPTEAEWEFAARGGNNAKATKFAGSDKLDEVGWFNENSENFTHLVRQKLPNELGLYDMSGNVWEWCQDWYAPYIASPQTDPIGPQSAVSRVVRGGCFFAGATKNRVSYRYCYSPTYSSNFIGLRLVLVP